MRPDLAEWSETKPLHRVASNSIPEEPFVSALVATTLPVLSAFEGFDHVSQGWFTLVKDPK